MPCPEQIAASFFATDASPSQLVLHNAAGHPHAVTQAEGGEKSNPHTPYLLWPRVQATGPMRIRFA